MRIMMVTSEAVPFAKTGGLADVASGLSNALADAGQDVTLVMPCYRRLIPEERRGQSVGRVSINFPSGTVSADLLQTKIPGSAVQVLLVDAPCYFDRKSLYVEGGSDYADNALRFMFLSRVAVEIARSIWVPDIIHCNDWQAGLIPGLILHERQLGTPVGQIGTVMTIHNLAFQGIFPDWQMENSGLPHHFFNWQQLEFHTKLNLLKGGIAIADMVTTVSPTYAQEICESENGYALDPVLIHRGEDLVGILNGVDTNVWNPSTDTHLAAQYSVDDVHHGKSQCKAALQRELGLAENSQAMLFGMITRLTDQKGLDLISQKAGQILGANVQFAFLGTGEERYEKYLRELQQSMPHKVAVCTGFDDALAHRIEAGADAYLMPSRFEPCGMNQQYSMIYGTPPIVHAVGGLADSVVDTNAATLANGTATGFVFHEYHADAFLDTFWRAVGHFQHYRQDWDKVVVNGMRRDSSWRASAAQYIQVYQRALSKANQ